MDPQNPIHQQDPVQQELPPQPDPQHADDDTLDFGYAQTESSQSIIKVVGVGGGGGNAVQHMYREGIINDVTYLVVNTDKQALHYNVIPNKLAIAELGAGAKPEVARAYAEEHIEEIRTALNDGTRMAFVTAGMGGGTGTGAGPVVARVAQELGLLTVGIVTIPFSFEGTDKIQMALDGVDEMRKHVDALLVVNNDRLIDIYPDLNFRNAMAKADDTLAFAAKSISDIINVPGYINLDFADVTTTLKGSGVALISTGKARGENRVTHAIQEAIKSPLLLDNDISHAKHLLFELCYSSTHPTEMREIGELNAFIKGINPRIKVIWGAMEDDTLGEDVKIILLASGFEFDGGNVVPQDEDPTPPPPSLSSLAAEAEAKAEAERIRQEEAARAERKLQRRKAEARERLGKLQQANALLAGMGLPVTPVPQDIVDLLGDEAQPSGEYNESCDNSTAEETISAPSITGSAGSGSSEGSEMQAAQEVEASESPAKEPPTAPSGERLEVIGERTVTGVDGAEEGKSPLPSNLSPLPSVGGGSTLDGVERIRRYYGDRTADQLRLDQVRRNYYLLDNDDLSNDELITLLEQLPAYSRSVDDVKQLRALKDGNRPAQQNLSGASDGTIHFD